jgi:hypothetical protein
MVRRSATGESQLRDTALKKVSVILRLTKAIGKVRIHASELERG